MKKIRLLTISATCERGGSDINLLRLLRNLDKNEYDILHLIPYPGPLADEFRNAGVGLEIVDMPRVRLFKNPLSYTMVILKFFPTVFQIKNIIEDYRINLVCTSGMVNLYGALAARLAHRPHILMANEYLSVLKAVTPYFLFLSDKIICCSNLTSRMFKKCDKVLVKHYGIDLNEFSPNINSKTSISESGVSSSLVTMVTRLTYWKGVEVFIKSAMYVKRNTNFIIFGEIVIGREKYAAKLERMIEKLDLKERVSIRTDKNKNIPQIIATSDVIVHASLGHEPFGIIIIEAMAVGRPVIASKIGGPLEIITDGVDGVLIEPGNPKVLAQAISGLLEDSKLAEEMGLRAREKAIEKFDLKEYTRSFDRIFKETLKEYSLKCARICIGKNLLLNISVPLAKMLVSVPPKPTDINKDIIKRILVIQLFGMGDLICSMPLLDALKKYFNQSKITLLIGTRLSGLADLIESKDEVIGYERGILSKAGLVFNIKKNKYDMAIVLNPLFQGTGIAYLSQAKYRLGYIRDYEGIQNIEKLSRLLTHPILPLDKPIHDVRRYLGIIGFLGIETVCSIPKLNIPENATKWADTYLRDNGVKQNDFILGINSHAAWESRCWDTKRFVEVADIMIERYNAKVVFFGSSAASDMRRMNLIRSCLKHKAIYASGKIDIPKLAALLNRCNLFLTNDTGLMHLAAALGLNMVALFGPGDQKKFGYERENIINVTADSLFCKPCALNYLYKENCPDNVCMENIEVGEVIKAIEILLENKK